MKNDRFLIGIVIGVILLVVIATILVLIRSQGEEYTADDDPAGVVHNYFLAIQRKEFEKAYDYLADDLEAKPDLDKFIRTVDQNTRYEAESSLQIGETNIAGDRARVEVSITTYHGGGPFERSSYSTPDVAHLKQFPNGQWKITGYPYPYWDYDWDTVED